jgi:hypothetical protein
MALATTVEVLAWLDERGWPHDPYELTEVQNREMRRALGICGHRTRRKQPCAFPPMANGRCKRANGAARRGVAHPNYQGKGHSKYVPQRWKDRYKKLSQPGLVDLSDQLAFLQLRLEDLLERTDPGETGRTWKALRQEWGKLQRALGTKPPTAESEAAVREAVMAISTLIGRGTTDAEAWDEVAKLWEQQRKTADTETRRRVLQRLFIKAEEAAEDYDAAAQAITEGIEDAMRSGLITKKTGNRILINVSERFAKLLALPIHSETEV